MVRSKCYFSKRNQIKENSAMTKHWRLACLTAVLATTLWPAAASAQLERILAMQGAGRAAISAGGSSLLTRKPTQLRLYMQLTAKGKTLEDALAKLKERQEAATAQLEALKADRKSIVFGVPNMSNEQSSRRKQVQAMVIQQMRARGKKVPKGLLNPQTVSISSTLTAHWPLKEESHEKLLLLSQRLQEKIKAADLSGSKEAEKLSAEEQEFEEEASQMTTQFGMGEEQQQPNQPQFVFVAVLPKAERQKGMAQAFVKAKAQAAELAQAAGVELGPLVGLSGGCSGQSGENPYARYGYGGGSDFLRQMMAERTGESPGEKQEEKPDESVGADPSALKFNCTVAAMFQMGK
jgi:hypothetical protein